MLKKLQRRTFLNMLAAATSLPLVTSLNRAFAQSPGTSIILLGTQGGPNFNLSRGETASLLLVGDRPYLIDCGYGTMRALHEAGINFLNIPDIFLTHLHDDHVSDLASLLSHQWTQGRVDQTTVHGPYGTDTLLEGALLFSQANTEIRFIDEGRSVRPENIFSAQVIEASEEITVVFEDDRLQVSAVENTHYPDWAKEQMPYRALSYRFDSDDRSVVFSGDTTYSENLIKLAQDADVLVCEVMEPVILRDWFDTVLANGGYQDNPENIWKHIVETHVTTEDAGRMAEAAGVTTLVLNHLLPGSIWEADDSTYLEGIRRHFQGEVIVGADQLVI